MKTLFLLLAALPAFSQTLHGQLCSREVDDGGPCIIWGAQVYAPPGTNPGQMWYGPQIRVLLRHNTPGLSVVMLAFAEPDPAVREGQRLFSVTVNDMMIYPRFDVYAAARGKAERPFRRSFVVPVLADGLIDIRLSWIAGTKQNAVFTWAEVWPTGVRVE